METTHGQRKAHYLSRRNESLNGIIIGYWKMKSLEVTDGTHWQLQEQYPEECHVWIFLDDASLIEDRGWGCVRRGLYHYGKDGTISVDFSQYDCSGILLRNREESYRVEMTLDRHMYLHANHTRLVLQKLPSEGLL